MNTSVSVRGLRWKFAYLAWLILIVVALIASIWLPESPATNAAVRAAIVTILAIKADQWLAGRAGTKPLF